MLSSLDNNNICSFLNIKASMVALLRGGALFRHLEMPDYTVETPLPADINKRSAAVAASHASTKAKLDAFMALKSRADVKKAGETDFDVERACNIYMGNALEKTLQAGVDKDFKTFMPAHRLLPVTATEQRYFCEVDTLEGKKVRSCVYDSASTNPPRMELPLQMVGDDIWEPTLYTCLDRCAVGRPLVDFFQLGLGMRTVGFFDPWHVVEGTFESFSKCLVPLSVGK